MKTTRWSFAAAAAFLAAACGDGAAPTPDRSASTSLATTASPSASASTSTSVSGSASDSTSATSSASDAATATSSASADPSATAVSSAAPSGSASVAPAAKGFAFPAPKNGVLSVADADKLVKVGAPSRLRLLEAGAEPLSKAVYSTTKGDVQKLRIELSQNMSMTAQGQPGPKIISPPQALDFDVTVDDVDASSSALVSMTLRGIKLTPVTGIDQATADELTKQLTGLTGYSLKQRIDSHGAAAETEAKLPTSAPKGAEVLVASMATVLRTLIPRLPDEPIGIGAKWQVISREDQGGASVVQLTEYVLKERSGNDLGLTFQTRQLAAGDTMKMPVGIPEGVGTKVTKFSTSLSGSLNVALKQMGPTKGRATQQTKLSLDVSAKGQTPDNIKTETDMKMTVTISRLKGTAASSAPAPAPSGAASSAPSAMPTMAPKP